MSEIPTITSPILTDAGRTIIDSVKKSIVDGTIISLEQLRAEIFSKYIVYFQTLGKNPFTPELYKRFSHKDEGIYNRNQQEITDVQTLLFREAGDLNRLLVNQFALMTQRADMIVNRTRAISGKIAALRNQIERRQFFSLGKSVVTIFDKFTDATKVDFTKSTSDIVLDFSISAVTLKSTENINRGVKVIDVTVTTNKTTDLGGLNIEDDLPNNPKSYEGIRFNFIPNTRPEAGVWRIETKNRQIDTATPTVTAGDTYVNLFQPLVFQDGNILNPVTAGSPVTQIDKGSNRITPDEFLFDDPESALSDKTFDGEGTYGRTFTRDDFVFTENKATEVQLMNRRLTMFDGDPRTFWEIEYTPVVTNLQNQLNTASDVDVNAFSNYQLLAQNYLNANSPEDLTITLTITLDNIYTINYLDLIPFFFISADEANFEVTNIVTQLGPAEVEEGIPGFKEDFDNVIGRDSNKTLTGSQLEQANVSNRFGFKGKGVWTFPKRRVKIIKVTVKQDQAIPAPYPLKNVQLLKKAAYSISQSKSASDNDSSTFSTKTKSSSGSGNVLERSRASRLIQFGYLETVVSELEGQNTGLIAGATSGNTVAQNTEAGTDNSKIQGTGGLGSILGGTISAGLLADTPSNIAGAAAAAIGGALIDALVSTGSSDSSNSSLSKSFNDTGFQIVKEYFRVLWHRARYAIGISEFGIWSKDYKSAGNIVSIPFTVINGKKEVTLTVAEQIPITFLNFDENQAWIEYYVVVNDKEVRIAPIVGAVSMLPHVGFPTSFQLDKVATGNTVNIRFMAKIKRPKSTELHDAESETPVLKNYEIKIIDL